MVTGSYPPEACGVGDYTAKLVEALKDGNNEIQVELIHGGNWGLWDTMDKFREIKARGVDILHIQYPTMGYRGGLAPRLLPCLFSPSIVSFHEFSNFNLKGRIGTIPLGLCADRIVFSSSFEREALLYYYPWKRNVSKVIPIGSNIPSSDNRWKNYDYIVYFGLIAPNKGLEDFLLLASLSQTRDYDFHYTVLGKVPEPFARYYLALRKKTEHMPIEWAIGLSEEEVMRKLASAGFGYLPFPDGASERRGSLLALLANGVITVTKVGAQTPACFSSFLCYAKNPDEALKKILQMRSDEELLNAKKIRIKEYMEGRTWSYIANMHINMYKDLQNYK